MHIRVYSAIALLSVEYHLRELAVIIIITIIKNVFSQALEYTGKTSLNRL